MWSRNNATAWFVLTITVTALTLTRCHCGDPVEPPPSLVGEYKGTYSVKVGNNEKVDQSVNLRFTSDHFLMELDTTVQGENLRIYCDASGAYRLAAEISFTLTDSNRTDKVCDSSMMPSGNFVIDQSVTNRVIMEQLRDSVFKRLDLTYY